MKVKKVFKYKKGDIVYCSAFVFTQYEPDVFNPIIFPYVKIIHSPENEKGIKKVLVRTEINNGYIHPFLVVAVKQIQTGVYFRGSPPSGSGWDGYSEGEPPEFYPDKYHDVYVLENMQSQRWSKLDYALEEDLRSEK